MGSNLVEWFSVPTPPPIEEKISPAEPPLVAPETHPLFGQMDVLVRVAIQENGPNWAGCVRQEEPRPPGLRQTTFMVPIKPLPASSRLLTTAATKKSGAQWPQKVTGNCTIGSSRAITRHNRSRGTRGRFPRHSDGG